MENNVTHAVALERGQTGRIEPEAAFKLAPLLLKQKGKALPLTLLHEAIQLLEPCHGLFVIASCLL